MTLMIIGVIEKKILINNTASVEIITIMMILITLILATNMITLSSYKSHHISDENLDIRNLHITTDNDKMHHQLHRQHQQQQ